MGMQSTSNVFMIRPVAFGFNEQTAVNNFYQNKPEEEVAASTQDRALAEFDLMVKMLIGAGVHVHLMEDTREPHTPDSLFPNNWVSMHHQGTVTLYPMFAENRRQERRADFIPFLVSQGFLISQVKLLTDHEQQEKFLEGTGSLVLDHNHKIAYASLSARTNRELVKDWSQQFGYRPIFFESWQVTPQGKKEVYHTNVVLSVGTDFALVATENIESGKNELIQSLQECGKHIIELNEKQISEFAGNALELSSESGERVLLLSERAWLSLHGHDRVWLESRMKIVSPPLYTIEDLGGGSARCMVAEIFLPQKK
jgi:hypothetical protein